LYCFHKTDTGSVSHIVDTLVIPSCMRFLQEVRRFVVVHAQKAGFSTEAVENLEICVDEACTNVIEHAYENNADNELNIIICIDTNRFSVCIRDRGKSFDQSRYNVPDVVQLTREGKSGGLGVHIIRQLMDEVEYITRGSVNEITLTKYLTRHQKSS